MSNREVMQQALEALELAKLNGKAGMYPEEIEEIADAIAGLRAALAEPQEPVAWSPALDYPDYEKQRVWANGAPRQEDIDYWAKQGLRITYAYTHPAPQRQPLTEDETMILLNETSGQHWCDEAHIQRFRAAIEKAHGITGEQK